MAAATQGPSGRRSQMTFWSKSDPVRISLDHTDHWSKLRIRSSEGQRGCGMPPGVVDLRELQRQSNGRKPELPAIQHRLKELEAMGDGRVSPRGAAVFSKVVSHDLHGNIPGNYMYTRPQPAANRDLMRSSYGERAKQGFQYWYQTRPNPTSFGKYGIGSYKTVLGLGWGPRT